MPRPKASTAHRDEWEPHRRELFRLFIVEGIPVAEIAKYMKQEYGFDKRPKDYEYRFRKWTLRRNLHEKELRSIESQLSRRMQAGRPSEIVISGVRWPESMILGRLGRHRGPWLPSEQSDVEMLPDFLARVQTPCPLMSELPEWPIELPWLQFNQHFRRALATLSNNTVARQLSRSRGEEPLLVTVMRPYVEKSIRDTTGPTRVDTIHSSRKMRAVLEVIAPEVHRGDHETAAEILHTGSQGSLAVELVRLFIYLETNNLEGQFKNITGWDVDFSISANVMDFLRCTGFLTQANVNWLGKSTDHTSRALLRRLLYHSIFDENSVDILGLLVPDHFDMKESVRIRGHRLPDLWLQGLETHDPDPEYIRTPHDMYDSESYAQTLLQCSCLSGNTNAVRFLLGLGADPYGTSTRSGDFSPLELAANLAHHDHAAIIAGLLLSKHTRCSLEFQKESIEGALGLAISNANTAFVVKLIPERKRLGHETIYPRYFTIAAERGGFDIIHVLVDSASRREYGFITLPEDILFAVVSHFPRGEDALNIIPEVNYLLELGADPTVLEFSNSETSIGRCILHRMLLYGNTGVHSNWEDSALELAKILRKHGRPSGRPKSTLEAHKQTAAFHQAISLGYSRLVEYLLDTGVDVDFCIEEFSYDMRRSPLLTALAHGQIGIAKMLLKRNPHLTLHGGEQNLAMKSGDDTELVTLLLEAGSATLDGWEDFLEQAILRRNLKSMELLLLMSTDVHAAISPTTILRALLISGDHDKACRQIEVCGYDSWALFEAVMLSHRANEYHKVMKRLLEARTSTSNDGFEIRAIAYAAICHDMYLLGVLMKVFGQGPWFAEFPTVPMQQGQDKFPSHWVPHSEPGREQHILDFVAIRNEYFKNDAVIKTLLEAGVPANGMRILPYYELAAETWKQLIAAGASPDSPGLLRHAMHKNSLEHVEVLYEAGVSLGKMHFHNDALKCSRSAVQLAVANGSLEMLQMLLRFGVDVNGPAGYWHGATCLQIAVGSGNIGLVRFLLEKGAKVNQRRSLCQGATAIETAAACGRLDILKLLLLQEQPLFDTAAERYQFIRAVELAETSDHASIMQILRQHINWDSYDQHLFDGLADHWECVVDDMTQEVLESEKEEIHGSHFWNQFRRKNDKTPAWLDDLVAQNEILEVLNRRPATQNESREPGMVLGEVLDGMPNFDDISDDAVDRDMAEGFSKGEQMQQFDWGFWDEQGIGRRFPE